MATQSKPNSGTLGNPEPPELRTVKGQMDVSGVSTNLATMALDAKPSASASSSLAVRVAARECESPHLSSQLPESDEVSGYSQSSEISSAIIGTVSGIAIFLAGVLTWILLCAFVMWIVTTTVPPKEEYVIQSAFIEVIP